MSALLFERNARVAMIGDSITHSGLAVAYLQEYYLTHMPEREVKIYNLGTGCDTSTGATAPARLEEIFSVNPTEAVVMFGVNDMGVLLYHENTTEAERASMAANRARHLAGIVKLVTTLREHGLPVTLCSAVGRDEHTDGTEGVLSYGATDALYEMFCDNITAVGTDALKATVDYITPMQALQRELVAIGGPSLFAPDRTHPNDLGQTVMARILLAAQGLPVTVPTAEALRDGWRERPLPPILQERRCAGLRWRDLSLVYPRQADRTPGMDLSARIAFWQEELKKPNLTPYFVKMYTNYVENAPEADAYLAEYLARTDALYSSGDITENAKEDLRV